jgi:hypothetical protein
MNSYITATLAREHAARLMADAAASRRVRSARRAANRTFPTDPGRPVPGLAPRRQSLTFTGRSAGC